MKKIVLFFGFVLSLLVGCSNIEEQISEEQAKQLVVAQHSNGNGVPEIISIEVKNNVYIVEWENKGDFEGGIDQVTKDRKIKMVEAYIH